METATIIKRPWIDPVLTRHESLALADAPLAPGDVDLLREDDIVAQVGSGIPCGPSVCGSNTMVIEMIEGR